MITRIGTLLAAAFMMLSAHAAGDDIMPAWQAPDYVMEEVVVTASAPIDGQAAAWTMPGYVMEEVIVTAPDLTISLLALGEEVGTEETRTSN